MSLNNFTVKSQEAVQKAAEIASKGGNQAVEPLHILKGIFLVDENVVPFLFGKLGVNFVSFSSLLDREIGALPKVSGGEPFLS
jgi:ATP-dependent Clp protease ATP-binding subunit ClpB